MSLGRLGAKQVVGVDLSDVAIGKARQLAEQTGLNNRVQFLCCDIYELDQHLPVDDQFDLVFTSFGTTKWFPDLRKWSQLIRRYSKANGAFLIVDFHPMIWTFDDKFEQIVQYSYFNQGPIVEYSKGTYANRDATIEKKSIRWNHSLADIVTVLLDQHFTIETFKEFDSLPMDAFVNMQQSPTDRQFRFKNYEGKIPLAYALKAKNTGEDLH
ncbi:unnamed protein product [Rotaria sp. Silwood2]|nr:unnamed protein product [Rotaria sp. Silwood2]